MNRAGVVVGIATKGRRDIVSRLVNILGNQTTVPRKIIIAPYSRSDVDENVLSDTVELIEGGQGLCSQRNVVIRRARELDCEVLVFFDDDFVPSSQYIEQISEQLRSSDFVLATGDVIADGARSEEIAFEDAAAMISAHTPHGRPVPVIGAYGCNMAIRMDALESRGTMFDENLPAYGWLEDALFSLQFCWPGECVTVPQAFGVHLGIKGGRVSGVRYGYSQVANPLYIWRVGTRLTLTGASNLILRSVLKNIQKSLRPEEFIDRRGRLKGNALALRDLLLFRIHPTRIDKL